MLIPRVKQSLRGKKIIYFSNGAYQHSKNKFQMFNCIHHEKDFHIKADWSFYATAHGKSASDGIVALFKREWSRNSLLCKPTEAILTPEKLTERGQKHFQNITTLFCSKIEHEKVSRSLKRRSDNAPAVQQILKNHCSKFKKHANTWELRVGTFINHSDSWKARVSELRIRMFCFDCRISISDLENPRITIYKPMRGNLVAERIFFSIQLPYWIHHFKFCNVSYDSSKQLCTRRI